MKDDIFSGKWHQIKGKIKEKWGKITDQDLTRINGKKEQLLGIIQERYGWEKKRAEEELRKFEQSLREDTYESSHRENWSERENEDREMMGGKYRDTSSNWDRNERQRENEDRLGRDRDNSSKDWNREKKDKDEDNRFKKRKIS